jgi:hypothetical protein
MKRSSSWALQDEGIHEVCGAPKVSVAHFVSGMITDRPGEFKKERLQSGSL